MALVLRVREGGRWEVGRGEGGREEMKEFGERGAIQSNLKKGTSE